jgi:phage recombination protein Bet
MAQGGTKQKENLPAKKTWEVRYQAGEVEVILNPEIITKYLVRGKPELVSMQEMSFFMGICRARGLNPFAGDCYLIKYAQNDPAAIITSIDFKRARAASQENCQGWQKGIIVRTQTAEIKNTNGLILEGETLIGGWFEATPKGWNVPFKLEVNLKGYLKKTSEGKITRFWQPENQPTMIAKVAESQGLSAVWSRWLGKLYTTDEIPEEDMGSGPLFDMGQNGSGMLQPEDFDTIAKAHLGDDTRKKAGLEVFLSKTADLQKTDMDSVKASALQYSENFWKSFDAWYSKQDSTKASPGQVNRKGPEPGTTPDPELSAALGEDTRPIDTQISCPLEGNETMSLEYCRKFCGDTATCEAWKPKKQ